MGEPTPLPIPPSRRLIQRTSRPFPGLARSRSSANFSPTNLSDKLGSTLPPLRSDVTTLQRKKGSDTADRSFALPTPPPTGSRRPYDTATNRSAVRPRKSSSAALVTSSALQATTLPPTNRLVHTSARSVSNRSSASLAISPFSARRTTSAISTTEITRQSYPVSIGILKHHFS